MDRLTSALPESDTDRTFALSIAPEPTPSLQPNMPDFAHLNMPEQSFGKFDPRSRRKLLAPQLAYRPWASRLFIFGGTMALTAYGALEMYNVVNVGGVTTLEWALLILFIANFSWIAMAFCTSLLGWLWLVFRAKKIPDSFAPLKAKTAVVMPIYNEAPSRVFATVQTIFEDVASTGHSDSFDFFFLSDTTDPNVFVAEEIAFLSIRERLGPLARIYYRHREKNISRKAGNIADFVTQWGGHYEHMLVLDADSLMTGHTIVALASAMEADPDSGIIQSLPLVINRNTLFARLQQFAARLYGPILASGLAVWSGRDGNYWGHNAIIRTKAFADYCGLPELRGKPPFGGHILSHDFVEAALMRRAGYAVYMLPTLGGSYEESPPSLIDLAARDRRWCQGNLQHIRVLPARGFVLPTRQHFITGIMSYLASPLWMAQLMVGIILVLQSHYIRPEYFTSEFSLFPAWPRFDAQRSLQLFIFTMAILLAPKAFGLIWALFQSKTRRACGGALALISSSLLEVIMSALFAPIMMLIQTGSVMKILFGFDTGWNPQRRDDGSIPFKAIVRRHRSHVLMGALTLFAGLLISPSLVAWMSPTIAGLLLAIPLSWASGQLSFGMSLRKIKLLSTPEENTPPPQAIRANALAQELSGLGMDDIDGLAQLYRNPVLRAHHQLFLPAGRRHHLGDISADRALAVAKIAEARSLEDALHWLRPKERMVVLNDRSLIDLLCHLPQTHTE